MKKMMLINLWGILLSFSFLFNGFAVLSILMELLLSIYNFMFIRKINYWRFLLVLITTSLFDYLVVKNSYLTNKLLIPFLLLVCLNTSIVNEIIFKLKTKCLVPAYFILSISLVIFVLVAIIIPYSPLLPTYKANLYSYIALLFIPMFVLMSACLIYKTINKKSLVNNYVLK